MNLGEIFRELWDYRHLLAMLTLKIIRIRYKQTLIGFIWALLLPSIYIFAGIMVQFGISLLSEKTLSLRDVSSISLKSLLWVLLVTSIRHATQTLTSNYNLVTKVYFPREVFPLSSLIAALLDFCIGLALLCFFFAYTGIGLSPFLIWLPLLILLYLLLLFGLCLFCACANLFFRDVKYLVEVLLTVGIFFTPVFYDSAIFGSYAWVLKINPATPLIEAIDRVVIRQIPPDYPWLCYTSLLSLAVFLIGAKVFHRAEPKFAEYI